MKYKKTLLLLLLFLMMYGAGAGAARLVEVFGGFHALRGETDNWGLGFLEEGTVPTGNVSAEELAKEDAFYVGDTQKKVIYLTFDCGYENGNTEKIMDALKKHNATGTYHHPDMSKIGDLESFGKEIGDVEKLYEEITGEKMVKLYRPPQGKFNLQNLKMAKELGYHTFFWSLAYVDWYEDKQPTPEEAYAKLLPRIHPGAVVLLHSTSSTNGQILDELLTKWEGMGYTFGTLMDFLK